MNLIIKNTPSRDICGVGYLIVFYYMLNESKNEKLVIVKKQQENFKQTIRRQTAGYIVAALGLVAGLAWNDAVKGLIDYLFPLAKNTLFVKFFYALVVTIIVVFISTYLLSSTKDSKD